MAHRETSFRIAHQRGNSAPERNGVGAGDDEARFFVNDLDRCAAHVGGDDRKAGGHGFERRIGASARFGNHGEEIELGEKRRGVLFTDPSNGQIGAALFQGFGIWLEAELGRARDAKLERCTGRERMTSGVEELFELLVGIDARERSDHDRALVASLRDVCGNVDTVRNDMHVDP